MRRRMLLALAVPALLFTSGCGGAHPREAQALMIREARMLCAEEGGVAYLNFDSEQELDEIRCRKDRP